MLVAIGELIDCVGSQYTLCYANRIACFPNFFREILVLVFSAYR